MILPLMQNLLPVCASLVPKLSLTKPAEEIDLAFLGTQMQLLCCSTWWCTSASWRRAMSLLSVWMGLLPQTFR